jgi:type I restriction enzyme S subunit
VASFNLSLVPPGTVVLSSRAPIGHLGIAGVELCTNQGCKSFVPSDGIDSVFLYFALKSSVADLQRLGSGATFAEVSKSQCENFEIPLPPLSEQRRIAGILREQMAAVERARAAARARLEAVKALPAAYLRQVFPQPAQPLPPGWRWVRLGEVCVQDRTIVEARSPDAANLPYLGLEDVESQTGRILKTSPQPDEGDGVSTTFRFTPEHVLYGKLRPYLNKVALPDFAGRCTTEMIPLRCGQQICREFLALILRRPETVEHAMQGKTGSRMPRADMDQLLQLEIPLPPLSEQERIAGILREQMAAVERARAAAEAELEAIEALPAALLRRAFSGEL